MARPNNSIATIKLPGDVSSRPIVPYALGVSNSNGWQATLPALTADAVIALTSDLADYVTLTTNQSISGQKTFTKPIYANHSDLTLIGQKGAFGLRAAAQSGQTVPHLGQINLSKNFGGDGNQYGIQMSAVDITNNLFNQMRVYQAGVAYQQYFNSSGVTRNLFTISTTGNLGMYGSTISDLQRSLTYTTPSRSGTLGLEVDIVDLTSL